MRTGFFGTPELAARVLSGLAESHEICFAVTAPDRESGRNRSMRPCAAKIRALELGIPVLQPEGLKAPDCMGAIRGFQADIFVVVAYGNLIPRQVFELPPLGTINLHPSLLPKYRGAAPIQWSLMHGETETGITVQLINERLDAGDIVIQERVPVDTAVTAADLMEIVSSRGAGIIGRAITLLASGDARPMSQDESSATYCGKIDREMARIRWHEPAAAIHNLVRALNPKPVAFSEFRGEPLKIWKTAIPSSGEVSGDAMPGSIVIHGKKRLLAAAGDGPIEILSLQPANRKVMDAISFINGFHPVSGDRFG